MADIISNHINVALYLGNVRDTGMNIPKSDVFIVQSYNYSCRKSRNQKGLPYGNTNITYLEFSLRNFTEKLETELLRGLQSAVAQEFTFIIDAKYDKSARLEECEDAFIARGFVVDIDEFFSTYYNSSSDDGQRFIRIKLLLSSIKYIGDNNDLELKINNV